MGEYPSFLRFDGHIEASVNGWITITVNPEASEEALEFEEPDKKVAMSFADESPEETYIPRNSYLYMPNAFGQVEVTGPIDAFGQRTRAFVKQLSLEALTAFRSLAPSLPSASMDSLAGKPPTVKELEV